MDKLTDPIVHPLPSVEEIRAAIPAEGIEIKALMAKFHRRIDDTNRLLFAQLVKEICLIEEIVHLKCRPQLPSETEIMRLIKEAKRPPTPRKKLRDNQILNSELIDETVYDFLSLSQHYADRYKDIFRAG